MSNRLFTSNFRKRVWNRIPKAFPVFIILVIITELGISHLAPYIAANSEYFGIEVKRRVTEMEALNRDILVLGDSTAGVGINPQILWEATGLTCMNLALQQGTSVAGNYFLLEDYLKSNDAPELIILMRTFLGWSIELDNTQTLNLLLANFPTEMITALGSTALMNTNYYMSLSQEIPNYLLPSQQGKWVIRKTAWQIIMGKQTIPSISRKSQQKFDAAVPRITGEAPYTIYNKGTPEGREQNLLIKLKRVRNNVFYASRLNSYYLEKLIQKAAEKEITIFIYLPPVRKEIYEDEAGKEYLISSKAFIEDVASSHDNVILMSNDFYVVTADQIRNSANHLNEEESIIFTNMIAEDVLEFINSYKK